MKKILLIIFGAGICFFTACESNPNSSHQGTSASESTGQDQELLQTGASAEIEAEHADSLYRQEAIRTTGQISADLNLDKEAQAIAEEIFYHRARRRAEVEEKLADNEFRYNQEMQSIEESVDQQLLGIMTYQQQKNYVQHRENYLDIDEHGIWSAGSTQAGGKAQNPLPEE
jgi:ABC-type Zn2+ transport system substrate-binding protein/surface adhesin